MEETINLMMEEIRKKMLSGSIEERVEKLTRLMDALGGDGDWHEKMPLKPFVRETMTIDPSPKNEKLSPPDALEIGDFILTKDANNDITMKRKGSDDTGVVFNDESGKQWTKLASLAASEAVATAEMKRSEEELRNALDRAIAQEGKNAEKFTDMLLGTEQSTEREKDKPKKEGISKTEPSDEQIVAKLEIDGIAFSKNDDGSFTMARAGKSVKIPDEDGKIWKKLEGIDLMEQDIGSRSELRQLLDAAINPDNSKKERKSDKIIGIKENDIEDWRKIIREFAEPEPAPYPGRRLEGYVLLDKKIDSELNNADARLSYTLADDLATRKSGPNSELANWSLKDSFDGIEKYAKEGLPTLGEKSAEMTKAMLASDSKNTKAPVIQIAAIEDGKSQNGRS